NIINTNFARGMYNFVSFPDNPHVYNIAFLIIEKGKVSGKGLINKTQRNTVKHLPPCITGNRYSDHFIQNLREPAAINSKWRTPSPQIGGIKILQSLPYDQFTWPFQLSIKNLP